MSPRPPLHPLADDESCDVLVIGSGPGGATTATVLAEAGCDVLILEEGNWIEQGAVPQFSLAQMAEQYRSGGVTVALGLPSIAYTEGSCAGGGSEVNSGLYWRPPLDVVERWRTEFDIHDLDPDEIDRIADEVEAALDVSLLPGPASAQSRVLERGARRLGWREGEIPRWMRYPGHVEGSPGSAGQRRSMTQTYLPRAIRAGARLAVGCRVDRLERLGSRAGIAHVVRAGSQHCTVRFTAVVVCAGAIHTPALLQRSGLRRNIGRSLAVHPTVKLTARFDTALNVPDDVPVHQVKEFAPSLSFGGSASHPGLLALSLLDHWSEFGHALADWQRLSVYYAAITSEGTGVVRAIPGVRDPLVTYHLTGRDRALLRSGMARLALLLLEAGADEVYPAYRGAPVVRRRRDLAGLSAGFRASKASVMTVHLCSTVPIGSSARCGADSLGLVHGTENVYVNDASMLPTAPGVNPQASVMAFAIRNARRLADTVAP